MKKDNPFSVYAAVSQLGFVIICPLLIFIVGGNYAVSRFGLPDWVMPVCVLVGIVFMLGGAVSYLSMLIRRYGKDSKKTPQVYSSRDDNDYYDDYQNYHK